jgi:hypothetical protein
VVVLREGTYLSGTLRLKSGVTLHVERGAKLLGSGRREDYDRLNFLALVMADEQENVGISGEGEIDGQGRILAGDMLHPVTRGSRPYAHEAERPVILNFRNCRGVTVRDITLRNSACWVQYYRDCDEVTIERVTVRSLAAITNDGIDIDGCRGVVVRNCDIDSGDDGICLKSSSRVCEDVLIEDCRVRSSCNAVKLGTASFGGFRNIVARRLHIYDTYFSGITLQIVDGGVMENVLICDVKITDTNNPFFIRLGHRNVDGAVGSIHGVTIRNVSAVIPNRGPEEMNKFSGPWRHRCVTLVTGSIMGLPGHPVRGVKFENVSIVYGGIGWEAERGHGLLDDLVKIPERADAYPESTMFGVLPAWGVFARHVEGLTFENVTLKVAGRDYRAAMVMDDVKGLVMDRVSIRSAGREPVVVLKDVTGAVIRQSAAPAGAVKFVDQRGRTRDVKGP